MTSLSRGWIAKKMNADYFSIALWKSLNKKLNIIINDNKKFDSDFFNESQVKKK